MKETMKEETIIVQQKIKITYNNDKARTLAIAKLLHDTDWMVVSDGAIENKSEKYTLSKTKDISIPFQ